MNQRYFEDVRVGAELPTLVNVPTAVMLFRFSAITWNAHRIHYDREYARSEGHPDVLVQAHLHGAWLTRVVTDWMGPMGRLAAIDWQNRGRAVPGDVLTCSGTVKQVAAEGLVGRVQLELSERNQRGELCVSGAAEVLLPSRGAGT
ncbi:MAG: MaoC family dehydratase N-terminal domain-containing protein [Lautropia sp.]